MSTIQPTKQSGSSPRKARLKSMERQILASGSVAISELAQAYGVSVMTVHRDLEVLERSGTVRRTRGVATALSSNLLESHIRYRQLANIGLKRKLAEAAAGLVEPGHTVMLDDSTTVAWMYEPLAKLRSLTIISHSIGLMGEFTRIDDARFISLGGVYNHRYEATVGLTTEQTIRSLHSDFAFMSASAVRSNGVYHPDESIVRVKRAMIESSTTSVLVIDSTKFEAESLYRVCDLNDFHHVLVDSRLDPEAAEMIRGGGVHLHLIDV